MVLQCFCKNEGQDKLHGKNMRVHNETQDGNFRCTSCERVRRKSGDVVVTGKRK